VGEIGWPRVSLILAGFLAWTAAPCHAQDGTPVVVVMVGERSPGAEAARDRLEALARSRGRDVVSEGDHARAVPPVGFDAERVEALGVALAGLERARSLARRLEDRQALGTLARTRDRLDAFLDLPGASRWAAEVEVGIAIVAHQAGDSSLAARSIRAAATLDPARSIGSAEAPPALVARARAIAEEIAGGPRASFLLVVDAVDARAYVDEARLDPVDAPEGRSAFRVVTSVGEHVLRIEAPGRRVYARRFEFYEGERPEVSIRLAQDPRALAMSRAIAAGRRGDLEAVGDELATVGPGPAIWVGTASRTGARSLFARCEAGSCEAPERLEDGRVLPSAAGAGTEWLDDSTLSTDSRVDLAGAGSARPRRRRALLLAAGGLAVAAGVIGAVLATRPDGGSGLRATIDFGELARRFR
jgi:hypothetical protein